MSRKPEADARSAAQKRLQMADIARLAGVSTATVSRALNHSPLVNEETRQRIMELAASLNYSINIGAQNLRLKANRTVAVVIPYEATTRQHLSDPFFLAMLGSLADALTERGYDMLVSRIDAQQLDAAAAPFDTGRALGIVLIGQWRRYEQLNQLAARKVPIVVWGAQLQKQLYVTVGSDNVQGGRLATAHLIAQGRRRIAFIGDTDLPEVAQRHQGYLAALAEQGIEADPALVVPAAFLPSSGSAAIQELDRRAVSFDAVFASSDLLAMTAVNALRASGRRVPADVAVVGYDDIELAGYFNPPLSSVCQPIRLAGRVLVDQLLTLIEGGAASSVLLPTELVVRGSSAP